MAWSYRKRIKIIPGVHLNISKRGISTSIRVKGTGINFSSLGTGLNANVMGFSNSYRFSGNPQQRRLHPEPQPIFTELSDNIFSADPHEITSQNMEGIKESILVAQKQKTDLLVDLNKIKRALIFTKAKKMASYIFIYGLVNNKIIMKLNEDLYAQKDAIKQMQAVINNSAVNIEIQFDDPSKRKYERIHNAFENLSTSHKIWDITGAHFQDRIAARSNADTVVNRRNAKIGFKSLSIINSNYEALYFQNINGADIYFYPTFTLMYTNDQNFAVIGIDELKLSFTSVSFTETASVPRDSKVISKTWAKVNKNGTPDRRFKDNYQIPVVKYGRLNFFTNTGVNEEYQFSNFEFTEEFAYAFQEYQSLCKEL